MIDPFPLDHIGKRRVYERHGGKEYWLVDPGTRLVTVCRRDPAGDFGKADILGGAGPSVEVAVFPGLVINFDTVFPVQPVVVRESPGSYCP